MQSQGPTQEAAVSRRRKPYQTPELIVHGAIAHLTQVDNLPPGKIKAAQDSQSGIGQGHAS